MSIYYVVLLCAAVAAAEKLNGRKESSSSAYYGKYPFLQNAVPQQIPGIIAAGSPNTAANEMNSTMYMSVIHYTCEAPTGVDPLLILYGTKSWTFPVQDVNLTLSYPASNPEVQFLTEEEGYIITAFKVVLYIDGFTAKGYITDGGILRDSLRLMFVCSRITSLSYEFWLYGTPRHQLPGIYQYPLIESLCN